MKKAYNVYSSKFGAYRINNKFEILFVGLILSLFLFVGFSLRGALAAPSSQATAPTVTDPATPVTVSSASYTIEGTTSDSSGTVTIYKDVNNNGTVDSPGDVVVATDAGITGNNFSVTVSLATGDNNFLATYIKPGKTESSAVDVPTITYSAVTVDTANTYFVNSPKYVRENHAGDLDAQIVTYEDTSEVEFYVDGDTGNPISGVDHGTSSAGYHWWRLYTALPAGEHTITGKVKIFGTWYDITGSGTVYSLDLPWAQYIIPQAGQYFRPNDKVIRVKADDEFDQFKKMNTVIDGTTYTVERADCNDQGSYVLCDLQNLGLAEGTYQADTTTYTLANNRYDHLISEEFTIDGTRPELTNFQITDIHSVYPDKVSVSADATDANGIDNVTFYVTAPRVGDGVCDGNGTHLTTALGSNTSGDTYVADIDTSGLDGDYCLNAIAEDVAANHSSILKIKATFDNTAPDVAITNPGEGDIVKGTVDVRGTISDANADHYYLKISNDTTHATVYSHTYYGGLQTFTDHSIYSWNTTGVADGSYTVDLEARDAAGNKDSGSVDTKTVTVDNTKPVLAFTSPADFSTPFSPGPTVTVEASDPGSGLSTLVIHVYDDTNTLLGACGTANSSELAAGEMSCDLSGLADGTYHIKAGAFDNAGNNKTISSGDFVIDTVKPSVDITTPSNGDILNTATFTVEGTASDAATSISEVKYTVTKITGIGGSYVSSIDSGSATGTTSWSFGVSGLADGFYRLKVQAFDAAGNWKYKYHDVEVDTTGPSEPTANPPAGDYTGTQSVELSSYDSGSGLAGIYYTTDGSDPDNSSTPYTGPISVAVDTTIKAVAYDNAGNPSTLSELVYGIAPVISGEGSINVTTTSITLIWTTDQPATSRVIYDTSPHSLGSAPNYGYAYSTVEDSTKVTDHSVTVTGLTSGTTYYFRTVSHGSPESVSGEFSSATKVASTNGTPTYRVSNSNSGSGGQGGGGTTLALNNPSGTGQTISTDGSNNDSGNSGNVKAESAGVSTDSTNSTDQGNDEGSSFSWWWLLLLLIPIATYYWYKKRKHNKEA